MRIPQPPPPYLDLLQELVKSTPDRLPLLVQGGPKHATNEYPHWDKLRRTPPPEGLSHEEWWLSIKMARAVFLKPLPLKDGRGEPFKVSRPDPVARLLSEIDRQTSGSIEISEEVTNENTRDRYIVSSLIEEAITSSQLEGAAATREVAKEMIRTNRAPRDKSERMIRNNFEAMERVKEWLHQPLTPAMILELQAILTEGTLESSDQVGRFRSPSDNVRVVDKHDEKVLHVPPAAEEIPERIDLLCEFANSEHDDYFLHDVAKGILLHFWLAFDHPFVDGNGRTARALFYWFVLSKDYWLFEFLSISRILRKSPSRYAKSFLFTETDDNDTTYFLLDQLEVIQMCVGDLKRYLQRKMKELRSTRNLLHNSSILNHRQVAVLSHSLRNTTAEYTIESHRKSHGVVYQTARSDLLDLHEKGLLELKRVRGRLVFSNPPQLEQRIKELR